MTMSNFAPHFENKALDEIKSITNNLLINSRLGDLTPETLRDQLIEIDALCTKAKLEAIEDRSRYAEHFIKQESSPD